jgi:hypothetical protein
MAVAYMQLELKRCKKRRVSRKKPPKKLIPESRMVIKALRVHESSFYFV